VSPSRRAFAPIGRLAIAAALAGLTAAAAGCDAGTNAPTSQFHPQSDGVDTIAHGIYIRDVFVLGPPIGSTLAAGQSAGLFLALIDENGPDKLVSITAPGSAASVTIPPGGIALRDQQAVYLTGPAPKLVLTGLTQPIIGGDTVRITLNFQNAGAISMVVPVVPRTDYYATFSPAPSPTPTSSATPAKHGKTKAGATASPSTPASASPSPSASSSG
jgi:copper(I)-binding protein